MKQPYYRFIYSIILLFHTAQAVSQSADSLANYWHQQANQLGEEEQLDSAIYCLKKVGNYAKSAKKWNQLATSQLDQGLYFMYLQSFDSSSHYYAQSLATAQNYLDLNNPIFANIHHLRGVVFFYLGDYNQALYHTKKTLDYELKNKADNSAIETTLNNIAAMYLEKSAYDKALEYFQQAENIYANANLVPTTLGLTYFNMGVCYNRKKQNHKALVYYQKAIKSFENNPNTSKKQFIKLYNSLSIAYRDLNQVEKAMAYIQQALKLQREMPYKKEITLTTLGYLYLKKGQQTAAQKVLKEALELYRDKKHPNVAKIYLTLGQCWAKESKHKKALEAYQKGIAILVQDFEDTGYNDPSIDKYITSPRNLLQLVQAKAKLLRQMGDQYTLLSLASYQLAADLVFKMQKSYPTISTQLFLAEITAPLHEEGFELAFEYYQKTKKIKDLNQALFFAERTKAKLLFDNVSTMSNKKKGGIPDSLIQREKDLQLDIAFYKKKWFAAKRKGQTDKQQIFQQHIFDLDARLERHKKHLQKDHPNYYLHNKLSNVPLLQQLQKQLLKSEKELFIEYFVSKNHLYAFVIKLTSAKLVKLCPTTELQQPLRLFWASLLNPKTKTYNDQDAFKHYSQNAYHLYQTLLAPFLSPLTKKLYIVQDEQLTFLPFAALLKTLPDKSNPNYLDLDYLTHYYPFGYSYSATLLLHNIQQPSINYIQPFFGFAPFGTTTERDSFRSLPFSVQEVKNASKILGGTFFSENKVTSEQFCQQAKASILHIASHGSSNKQSPAYSYLAFKGKEHLHAYEIQHTNIQSNLVVLSACETGLGKFVPGEGSLSLAQSFMYAGVPSVLMTLWKVRDKSSAMLMQHFYEHISDGTPKLEALQHAQEDYLMINADPQTAHPYFWSAYVVLGDPKSPIPYTPNNNKWWYLVFFGIIGIGIAIKKYSILVK